MTTPIETLLPRIDAAIERIASGCGAMRIPAEDTDPDLVLAECRALLAQMQARLPDDVLAAAVKQAIAPQAAQEHPSVPTQAVRDVLAERQRQIEREGWTPQHDDDDEHTSGDLARAGACYLLNAATLLPEDAQKKPPAPWPWSRLDWKPKNQRSDMVRGVALGLAEIERMDRAALTVKED